MKYSKRVREEAALICAIAASTAGVYWNYSETVHSLGLRECSEAHELAVQAWHSLFPHYEADDRARDAEAESMIRSGWTP